MICYGNQTASKQPRLKRPLKTMLTSIHFWFNQNVTILRYRKIKAATRQLRTEKVYSWLNVQYQRQLNNTWCNSSWRRCENRGDSSLFYAEKSEFTYITSCKSNGLRFDIRFAISLCLEWLLYFSCCGKHWRKLLTLWCKLDTASDGKTFKMYKR